MSTTPPSDFFRTLLANYQDWGEAHLSLEAALDELYPGHRSVRPAGSPHSIWELLEHIRITQRNILDFCLRGPYRELDWPEGYWPAAAAPPGDGAWERSIDVVAEDREGLRRLAVDPGVDLDATVPHATRPGQTFARAFLLAQDHAAYHIGQVALVRRILEGG